MKSKKLSWKKRGVILGAAAVLALSSAVMPMSILAEEAKTESSARTDGMIHLNTDYPGVTAKPGSTVTFTLYLTNGTETSENLELSAELPEGWSGYFRGSDSEVSSVHAEAGLEKADSPKLSYSLTVPEEAEDGDYSIVLNGEGEENSTDTTLKVHVSQEEAGESSFTAQYPEQQGASGASFSFDTTLINNGASSQSYSLSSNAPEGWNVKFTPSGESSNVASLPVDAGATQGITTAITPPDTVEQGDYKITLTAVSAEQTLNLDLTITITGTYEVALSTPTGNLSASAYAGEETKVTMVVSNSGNVALENLQLSAQGSTDWNITFDEDTIDALEAGDSKEVTAYITPAKNAVIGDYVTAIKVKNDQVSAEADLRVSVKNHTTWGIIAIVAIVILVAGLGMVIRKYGRR